MYFVIFLIWHHKILRSYEEVDKLMCDVRQHSNCALAGKYMLKVSKIAFLNFNGNLLVDGRVEQ